MGGKDSPTPILVSDGIQQQEGLASPPFSPMKRKGSICSSGSSASGSSISSGPLSSPTSFKRSPSIRYVPRSKSSVNLEMRQKISEASPVTEPRTRGAGVRRSSTLNREGSFARQQRERASAITRQASLPRSSASSFTEGMIPLSLKCVLVGDSAVGKTSMLQSYTSDKFTATHTPTIYDKFSSKYMQTMLQCSVMKIPFKE